MADELKGNEYQRELFERLRKNVSLQKEEECFGPCLQESMWFLIEKPNPKMADIIRAVPTTCPYCPSGEKSRAAANSGCLDEIYSAVKAAGKG